jgi:hypothetical protein
VADACAAPKITAAESAAAPSSITARLRRPAGTIVKTRLVTTSFLSLAARASVEGGGCGLVAGGSKLVAIPLRLQASVAAEAVEGRSSGLGPHAVTDAGLRMELGGRQAASLLALLLRRANETVSADSPSTSGAGDNSATAAKTPGLRGRPRRRSRGHDRPAPSWERPSPLSDLRKPRDGLAQPGARRFRLRTVRPARNCAPEGMRLSAL